MEPVEVLGDAPVAGLGEPEVAFHDQEGMLDLGPDGCFAGLDSPVVGRQLSENAFAGRDAELLRG